MAAKPTREEDGEEHRLRLIAGRLGLRLVRGRLPAADGRELYCLRSMSDATYVLGNRPEGGLGLVSSAYGREKVVRWLSLTDIEQVLASRSEPAPRAWGDRHRPKAARLTPAIGETAVDIATATPCM
jgi:hypothetical protein